MKAVLIGVICGCMLVLTAFTALFLEGLTRATNQLPITIDQAIAREANLTRAAVAAQITPVVAKLDNQVTSLRTDLFARVDKIEGDANLQITDTRAALVKEVQDTRTPLLALVPPAQTMLVNAGALTKDVQDSLDDSYFDAKGLLASATVATTQAALTMETVRTEAPVLLGHVSGITHDFHDATTALDHKYFNPPPQTKGQKVKTFLSTLQTILIAALRGGAI